ncbi:MAG: DUF4893 domain-containing protein [Sphingomicrobium sp.]
MRILFPLLAATTLLSGCTLVRQQAAMVPQKTNDWHAVVTEADRARLREWRTTMVKALATARAAGHGAAIDAEGALLRPDAALGGAIPNGLYACRIIKVGAKSEGMLDYVSYPAFRCQIGTAERRHLTKLSGSQRAVGIIFPGGELRDVFLGTLALGDERQAFPYGVDPMRDLAGYVERIGERRFRLLLPKPHFESQLDVMELVPVL